MKRYTLNMTRGYAPRVKHNIDSWKNVLLLFAMNRFKSLTVHQLWRVTRDHAKSSPQAYVAWLEFERYINPVTKVNK